MTNCFCTIRTNRENQKTSLLDYRVTVRSVLKTQQKGLGWQVCAVAPSLACAGGASGMPRRHRCLLLSVPRPSDTDGNRKPPVDATHTRGERCVPVCFVSLSGGNTVFLCRWRLRSCSSFSLLSSSSTRPVCNIWFIDWEKLNLLPKNAFGFCFGFPAQRQLLCMCTPRPKHQKEGDWTISVAALTLWNSLLSNTKTFPTHPPIPLKSALKNSPFPTRLLHPTPSFVCFICLFED